MTFKSILLATFVSVPLATVALAAETITVDDAYARSSGKSAKAGAAFMAIRNQSGSDDRLIGVTSDAAARVELHTHKVDENGVAKMSHVEEGFIIPAGETYVLQRGGDHVMFMGLTQPFEEGATVPVTLIFEQAGEIDIAVPVDQERHDSGAHSN